MGTLPRGADTQHRRFGTGGVRVMLKGGVCVELGAAWARGEVRGSQPVKPPWCQQKAQLCSTTQSMTPARVPALRCVLPSKQSHARVEVCRHAGPSFTLTVPSSMLGGEQDVWWLLQESVLWEA